MKPYYQTDGITLYHGDCGEVEVPCDLLVTDPPYGQEFKSGKSDLWGTVHGDNDLPGTEARLLHALKSLRRGRHVYIFGTRFDLAKLPLCGVTELIWDKEIIGMGDLTAPWGPQHERITFANYELSKANREKGYGNLSARLRKGKRPAKSSREQRQGEAPSHGKARRHPAPAYREQQRHGRDGL